MAAALSADDYRVRFVVPGPAMRRVQTDRYEADLESPESLAELHRLLVAADDAPVGAVFNFLGLSEPFCHAGWPAADAPLAVSLWTFNVVKEFESDLRTSAEEGGGWFINLTSLGGKFGVDSERKAALTAAPTIGIAKTLLRENPKLVVKSIDVDAGLAPASLAAQLLAELAAGDPLVEVGLSRQGRWQLKLEKDPVQHDASDLVLEPGSVVLVTGGAYGVTADVAKALAERWQPRLVLVGRSPLPGPEPSEVAGKTPAELRRHLLAAAKSSGQRVVPADIERQIARLLKDRQIRANVEACRAAGAEVEYLALDVRDAGALSGLLDDLYARYGRIDGVVHGAGIVEDKRIRDKTADSFANVFRTKVTSATVLAEKLRPEGLKFLVFFSSVSGRFGNAGQVDYSAANEFLNKLANYLDARWPGKVVAMNWGPWDGGMVTDELRRMYATVGFDMIPIDVGVQYFTREIERSRRRSAEVVVSGSVERMLAMGHAE
ncbi:MAG: SDR family NAD(P)-dependent oxidoreductase [Pirellulales bacterium]|nr:SDR family NAD(P)-dependent oxidoreductase [Pirellulales bacterium]